MQSHTASSPYLQGVLRANGNIEINADNVIVARGDSTVRLNESGTNTVVLNGDIDFNYSGGTSGTKIDADVLVNLTRRFFSVDRQCSKKSRHRTSGR